jgi:hypothetical protein
MPSRHLLPTEDAVYASVCTELDSEGLFPTTLPEDELPSLSAALSDEHFPDPFQPGVLQHAVQLFLRSLDVPGGRVSGSSVDYKNDPFGSFAKIVLIDATILQVLTSPSASTSHVLDAVARLGLKPSLRLSVAQYFTPFLVALAGRWLAFAGFNGISFVSSSAEDDKQQTLDVFETLCSLASVWDVLEP